MNIMYTILILTILAISSVSNAYPVPKELVDGVITVTTKEGKTYTFSANEYKVVKRTRKTKQAPPVIIVNHPNEEVQIHKNQLILGVREDFIKVRTEAYPGRVKVYSEKGPVFDLLYMRNKTLKDLGLGLGIGLGIDTNGTVKGAVGVGF